VMRNMSGPHDYTSMYYLGVPLLFYAAGFSLLKVSRRPLLAWGLLVVVLVLFYTANRHTQALHRKLERESDVAASLSQYTWDMMEIRAALPARGAVVAMAHGFPNAPYGFGFYLPEHYLGEMDAADFAIATGSSGLSGNLTPENRRLFLLKANPSP